MIRTTITILAACFLSSVLALPMTVSDRIAALEQKIKVQELAQRLAEVQESWPSQQKKPICPKHGHNAYYCDYDSLGCDCKSTLDDSPCSETGKDNGC